MIEADLIRQDIHLYLEQHQKKDLLRFLTAGSVDDGKSTLIGRLLYDSHTVYDDQLAALKRDSAKKSSAGGEIDYSLLVDGLQSEREQGITIDVAYRYFATPRRKFIIADTPGHEQYTRNMATGASTCNLAVILMDARTGVLPQTRRHSFIAALLGIKHLVIAVNKMDLVDWSQEVFEKIREDYTDFATKLDVSDIHFIPLSALQGDNVVVKSLEMPWHAGPPLLGYLETVHIASDRNFIDLRFPVQYVVRPHLNFRGFCGTVTSGVIRKGDPVLVLPAGRTSRVKSIVTHAGELDEAFPPLAVTLTLEDEVDVGRGNMLVHPRNLPHRETNFEAMVVWMNDAPLRPGKNYLIKHTTHVVPGEVVACDYRIDVNTLHRVPAAGLALNEIGRVTFTLTRPIFFDPYVRNRGTGAFVVIDRQTNATLGAGMILDRQPSELSVSKTARELAKPQPRAVRSQVGSAEREQQFGHKAVVVWLTGLPKSGKSTVAFALEKRLFVLGCKAFVLDGYDLRQGLSRDLGFTADDRSENSRRAAEVARLAVDAGYIVVANFVSPYTSDRVTARDTIGAARYVEVYVNTPLDICAGRDQALFAKARSGEIKNFTGISAPYEPPAQPDLVLSAHQLTTDQAVDRVIQLLQQKGFLGSKP